MTRATAAEIQEQATLWVARMDGDRWDAAAEAELERWIEIDPRHDGALLAAQAAWSMLDPRSSAQPAVAVEDAPATASDHTPRVTRRWLMGGLTGLTAASIAGVFFIRSLPTRYETEVGEIRRIPLADGSTAAINTASEVKITLASDERRVVLDRGEAWFQVAKDKTRPFIVEAGPVRVRAVGTAFSVRRRDGGADVLVTEGIVEAWSEDGSDARVRISAGESAFVSNHAAASPLPAAPSSVDRALAWRSGKIDLMGQPLSAAVAEFNRYNHRQMIIVDPKLANEGFDGVFRTDDPAGFAQMVHVSLAVPVDASSSDRILIGIPAR